MSSQQRQLFYLHSGHTGQRGSVFILVAAMLAVLALLTISFAFSSRTELYASRNWTNTVQSRMAALTFTPLYTTTGSDTEYAQLRSANTDGTNVNFKTQTVSITDSVGLSEELSDSATETSARSVSETQSEANIAPTDLASEYTVEDTSAKLNINAVWPIEESNERISLESDTATLATPPGVIPLSMLSDLIEARLLAAQVSGVNASELARQIAEHRLGPDRAPGEAGKDDNANASSTRLDRDNIDNDFDGVTDESDENRLSPRHDGLDNDRDGTIDESDESLASDGIDNDYDGRIDENSEALDEPEEALADPRLKPYGDDQPFTRLIELMALPAMTTEAYQALEPCLTVFNTSSDSWVEGESTDGLLEGVGQIDPNTASAETILAALERRYPEAEPMLLAQFTANMIDRRDTDDIPTRLNVGSRFVLGLEMTPYINEVCPDTPSFDEEGDDGEFIELYNPYQRSIALDGWTLRTENQTIRLHGSIAANGYLIVTDDYDESYDPTPEGGSGFGSFYNVFGVVPTGSAHRLIESQDMDLIGYAGKVALYDNESNLIDRFDYTGGMWEGALVSFQRNDPRLRGSEQSVATPFAANNASTSSSERSRALAMQTRWQNKPFGTALEVMLVSSAFALPQGTEDELHPWALPELDADGQTQLDVRLVDCFRVGSHYQPETKTSSTTDAGTDSDSTVSTADVVFGRINLNTAPLALLARLPEMDQELLEGIYLSRDGDQYLDEDSDYIWQSRSPFGDARWQNFSDFLLDPTVWDEQTLYERLDHVYAFSRLVCFQTLSLSYRSETPTWDDEDRVAAPTRVERLVTIDRGAFETVDFYMLPPEGSQRTDADEYYATPLTEEFTGLDLEALLDATEKKNMEFLENYPDRRESALRLYADDDSTATDQE